MSFIKNAASSAKELSLASGFTAVIKRDTNSSFIGSKPSTVLFFVALCIGIIIALMFIFFTFRYLIRSRYGIYMPSAGYIGSPFDMSQANRNNISPLGPYLVNDGFNYVIAFRPPGDAYGGVTRRRKLTQEEVDEKFPVQSYSGWLASDAASSVFVDAVDRENQSLDAIIVQGAPGARIVDARSRSTLGLTVGSTQDEKRLRASQTAENAEGEIVESKEPVEASLESTGEATPENVPETSPDTASTLSDHHHPLHFTSGDCTICLEPFQEDDQVRGLSCGHVFHEECIDPWLTNRRGCCPTCKHEFIQEEETPHEDLDPDYRDIDSIFSVERPPLSQIVYRKPTQFKAKTLLVCLQLVRDGHYHTDGLVGMDDDDERPSVQAFDDVNPNGPHGQYYQKMISTSFDCPPMPDITTINWKIKQLLRSHPFNEEDVADIDQLAYSAALGMYKWYMVPFWRIMGITELDMYYHFVVWSYEKKKDHRVFGNARNPTTTNGSNHTDNQQEANVVPADATTSAASSHESTSTLPEGTSASASREEAARHSGMMV